MKKYIRAIICIIFSLIKFSVIKLFHFSRFHFSMVNIFSPFTEIDLGKKSYLRLSKLIRARSGVKLKVRNEARLEIGEATSFNHGCMIICHDEVKIGANVQFGPNVLIYDHDHDYRIEGGIKKLKYKTEPVVIGNNVWIGANVVILRGTIIGDNCVIGAGSVLKGNFENNKIIVQKRETTVTSYEKK